MTFEGFIYRLSRYFISGST